MAPPENSTRLVQPERFCPLKAWGRRDLAPVLTPFVALVAVGSANGGYFPESWGWSTIGLTAVGGLALLLRERIIVARRELLTLGALAAFASWTMLSAAWSVLPEQSRLEAERALVYVAALAAVLLVGSGESIPRLVAGVLAGVTVLSLYALVGRAVEGEDVDAFQGTLLFEPLGYANALGILAALGILLALGFTVQRSAAVGRVLAAACVPPLALALALTSSRGAWIALAIGAVAAVALARSRRLFLVVLIVVAVLATVAARTGVSGNDRDHYWQVAWREYEENPVLGSGAGTYMEYWLRYRPVERDVRDAHSLYLETLAELGPLGLALLMTTLAVPLAVAMRARSRKLVPAVSGAYVAYLFHAGVDWDWEMPAVTLTAFFLAGTLLLASRRGAATVTVSPASRLGGGALLGAVGLLALLGLLENGAFGFG